MAAKCSRNLTTRSRPGRWPDRCRTTAMDAIAIEKKPIQPVASDCSRTPPTGRCDRVDRADVVQAEEAALEEVVAFGVFPVDPPGEVDQQLVEDPAEKPISRLPSTANTSSAAHACTGGFTSPKSHSYAAARRPGAGTTPGTAGSAAIRQMPG